MRRIEAKQAGLSRAVPGKRGEALSASEIGTHRLLAVHALEQRPNLCA
ncbi:MAG TPA: hypothetical protein VI122_21245 [Thermoleophilaceae bacterium]